MAKEIVIEPVAPYTNHGNTVASWTLVAFVTVGFIVGAVGFDIASTFVFIVGVALIAIGLIACLALKSAGFGQGGAKTLARAKH